MNNTNRIAPALVISMNTGLYISESPIQNYYFAGHALANRLESIRIDAM